MPTQTIELEAVLIRHGISPVFRPAFISFVEHGERNTELMLRLETCINYQAALGEIVELLAQPLQHLHGSTVRFESLEIPENL